MKALLALLVMVFLAGTLLLLTDGRDDESAEGRVFAPPTRFGRPVAPPPAVAGTARAPGGTVTVAHPSVPVHRAHPPLLPPEVKREALRAGRLDDDPRESARRLDELARDLSSAERRDLYDVLADEGSPGDDRATAAEVLARSRQEDAVGLLADVALRPLPPARDDIRRDFERVLRARAIEGLGQHPSAQASTALRDVMSRADDAFLVDRAHRADWARNHRGPLPEAQDRRALEELLQRDSSAKPVRR